MSTTDYKSLFDQFNDLNVWVVGDVMIDAYYWGKVDRISPEAPVPVVEVANKEERLGGAANVALNVKALGATPIICSVVGDDDKGKVINQLFEKRGFSNKGVICSNERPTTVKTRIISGGQHMLRVDEETTAGLSDHEEKLFLDRMTAMFNEQAPDVIILEDYNKGVLTKSVIDFVIDEANKRNIPTTVDPKKENFYAYSKCTLFKPNLKELREGTKQDFDKSDDIAMIAAIQVMEDKLNNKMSLVTLSELGVVIKEKDSKVHVPAHKRKILDVSGAGDTVISVASLVLACGGSLENIAQLSNLAGGMVCEKTGVVPIDKQALLNEAERL